MFLSDKDILDSIKNQEIKIEPFEKNNVNSASLDLRLGNDFLVLSYHSGEGVIRMEEKKEYERKEGNRIIIPPGEFILGTTREYICVPSSMLAIVEGKSSIGRNGLFVQNAGLVDPGFEGTLTLELFNSNRLPIELTSGTRICQIFFAYLKTPSMFPYKGKYFKQRGTVESRLYQEKGD